MTMQLIQGIKRFMRQDDGVTAIEYALIAALIGVAAIAGATAVGTSIDILFTTISTKVKA